ncbi:MAG: META domain-containing protein [Gammaproteobacteria bacterium]|nr:META domain-containing protein [Gammaproteobacteria bacterium]
MFCPAINSQCYWLSRETPGEVRASLRQLYAERSAQPYEPVCVVVSAHIDRESGREGFAADYDGLITIAHTYGRCNETRIVTRGDLQHHRWILVSVNGEALRPDQLEKTPELDFGEQMHVSGNSGCNHISGTAALREAFFTIENLIATRRLCKPAQNELERTLQGVYAGESTITLDREKTLTLDAGETVLRFRLQDWVK